MMAENFFRYGKMRNPLVAVPFDIEFIQQPPEEVRKSIFFNFSIAIRSASGPVNVEKARFEQFLNENSLKNGCSYNIRLRHQEGVEERRIFLTLVDADTYEPIQYEGKDDSPRMQRALLTHESICTRCQGHKSCGNKSEAPSDPRIVNRGTLQFHLRCNQNCLRNPGNPRENRRFSIALSFEDSTFDKNRIVVLSNKIFVHNNSKHNKDKKKKGEIKREPSPDLFEPILIFPKVGILEQSFNFYSKEWCKPGVSFRVMCLQRACELHITNMVLHMALSVYLPHYLSPGTLPITLFYNEHPVFTFHYEVQRHAEIRENLILQKRGQTDGQIDPNSGTAISYVIMESENPGYYLHSYAPPYPAPYNYGPPQIQMHYPPNYHPGSSSSSSLSPNGSHVSGESNSHSPIGYFPNEPCY